MSRDAWKILGMAHSVNPLCGCDIRAKSRRVGPGFTLTAVEQVGAALYVTCTHCQATWEVQPVISKQRKHAGEER